MIRLFSLNMGQGKIPEVVHFLKKSKSDVICLQEVWQADFEGVQKGLGMGGLFVPMSQKDFRPDPTGIGISAGQWNVADIRQFCYAGYYSVLPLHTKDDMRTTNWWFLYYHIRGCTIGNIHFIWTPNGKPDELQRKALKPLLGFLEGIPEIVVCGDLNAPRGGEIFSIFAGRYKDNVPLEYQTSLDPSHKGYNTVWGKKCMTDGVFSTSGYKVKNVVLHSGFSDHCAITAEIE